MSNVTAGSADVQGELWGSNPRAWATIEEPKMAPLFRAVLDALALPPRSRLLDAGCGAGLAAELASRRGIAVIGVDASAAMLEVARERVLGARFDQGDLEQLPYPSAEFDAAMAINSIFYCHRMSAAVKELARVTRPGGKVVITAWGTAAECEMAPVFQALLALLPPKPLGGGPFALGAPGALEQLLAQEGLRPERTGTVLCRFESKDWDHAWQGMSSAGPVQAAIRAVGVDAVKAVTHKALAAFTDREGRIAMNNAFRWVLALKA